MVMVVSNFENSGIDGVSEINCNKMDYIDVSVRCWRPYVLVTNICHRHHILAYNDVGDRLKKILKTELTESGIQIDTRFFSLMKLDRFRCDYCSIIFEFAKCMSNRTCTFYIVQNIEWPLIEIERHYNICIGVGTFE